MFLGSKVRLARGADNLTAINQTLLATGEYTRKQKRTMCDGRDGSASEGGEILGKAVGQNYVVKWRPDLFSQQLSPTGYSAQVTCEGICKLFALFVCSSARVHSEMT
jgi:hypothetical protein